MELIDRLDDRYTDHGRQLVEQLIVDRHYHDKAVERSSHCVKQPTRLWRAWRPSMFGLLFLPSATWSHCTPYLAICQTWGWLSFTLLVLSEPTVAISLSR